MRNKLMVLIAAAALLVVGGVAFEAKATMGVGLKTLRRRQILTRQSRRRVAIVKDCSARLAPLYSVSRYAFACLALCHTQ